MKVGDQVYTPRFCTVTIKEVFESVEDAWKAGYVEYTDYRGDPGWGVRGKSLDMYHMEFAAFRV